MLDYIFMFFVFFISKKSQRSRFVFPSLYSFTLDTTQPCFHVGFGAKKALRSHPNTSVR